LELLTNSDENTDQRNWLTAASEMPVYGIFFNIFSSIQTTPFGH
jgi:hypothetical protein